jgi:methanogenic corrinoid protein MtbC1
MSRMTRTYRAAQTLVNGPPVLNYLQADTTIAILVAAAEEGVPPVSRISEGLRKQFGEITVKPMPMRQFIGSAVRAILEGHGFEVAERGVRLPTDKVFSSGATYRKVLVQTSDNDSWVERVFERLTSEEAKRAISFLQSRGF